MALPPGQTPAPLQRFGLPAFAPIHPETGPDPLVTVTGMVRRPTQVRLADLLTLPGRREQTSDLHCVTTWTAQDLHWQGVPFAAVLDHLAALVEPHPEARWVTVTGLDGYAGCLRLDDARAPDVLLADHLDDEAVPARLIAPAQYGYKSVKHVCAIAYRTTYEPGPARWLAHPRGRADREERSRGLPGLLWRPVWRALLPAVRRRYAHHQSSAR